MLSAFVLGIALVAGILLAGRWYATADAKAVLKAAKWLLLATIIAVVIFFVFSGRLTWAFAALPALLPWFFRLRAFARAAKTFARMRQAYGKGAGVTGTGGSSDIETRYLRMRLDHDTGVMSGEVISGPFSGQCLDDMNMAELVNFWRSCEVDEPESGRVLAAYLDRTYPEWRDIRNDNPGEFGSSQSTAMDRAQALQILGLAEGATRAQIKEAHRRLISGMHPDHGGSDYLAAQINQAKDFLLEY